MAFSTEVRRAINGVLRPFNLQIGTLNSARAEQSRVQFLVESGALDRQAYPLSPGMVDFDPAPLAEALKTYADGLQSLTSGNNAVGFDPNNSYFFGSDMHVLYLMVRSLRPRRIVEIGCGNSTRISRQAIMDGGLDTQITAIDPQPRRDISAMVDAFEQMRLEEMSNFGVFETLEANDILFVDSSHEVRVGNDVARIFCEIIPRLKPGVVVHVHDIFLPFDYPPDFATAMPEWGEQYVLHAWLQHSGAEILWPGRYLQECRPELRSSLPFLAEGPGQSFWFKLAEIAQ